MIFLLSMSLAQAQMFSLKPLNRISAGASYVDTSMGVSASFESRLTHVIYLNIGGFRSLSDLEFEGEELKDQLKLRHGIWAAPGIRFPHRYNKGVNAINLDLVARAGFGCFFIAVADKPDAFNMEPGAVFGADFILSFRNVGLRLSGKGVYQKAYASTVDQALVLISPLTSLEFYTQF